MSVNFKSDNIQKHKELSDGIKGNLEVVGGNTVKEKEGHGAYYANLPEGIDRKTVEEVAKYNTRFVTASHIAVGEVAAEIFKNDKTINEVNAQIGYFGKTDTIDIGVSRTKVYQNHLADDPADKEITKHLVMKTTVTSQSAKGYGLKAIRESMSEEFQGIAAK